MSSGLSLATLFSPSKEPSKMIDTPGAGIRCLFLPSSSFRRFVSCLAESEMAGGMQICFRLTRKSRFSRPGTVARIAHWMQPVFSVGVAAKTSAGQ